MFSFFDIQSQILHAWWLAEQGQANEGLALLHQGLNAYQESGGGLAVTYKLALLSEVYLKADQVEDGLTTLAEAHAVATRNGEEWFVAELHRLTGDCLLAQAESMQDGLERESVIREAELAFQRALKVSRDQHAKAFELRAAMSLGRLWRQHHKTGEARRMMAEIYDQFTEGHDTLDLKEARAWLDGLA